MEFRSRRLGWLLVLIATHLGGGAVRLNAGEISFKISSSPRHDGRIDPKLFGNFVELLDDLVPGMWAESLNDRGFEGVAQAANWVYYDGSPTFCDRAWDKSEDWSIERQGSFNGTQCARISGQKDRPSGLTQSSLAVKTGAGYQVSMWVRGQGDVRAAAVLKTKKPAGGFDELASIDLGKPSNAWNRVSGLLKSMGTTEHAIFEIRVQGEGTLWVDKVSLLPEQNLLGWRVDVAQAIKECRPSVVRWGGSVVDPGAYRWKGGIGDRDLRVPFPNTNWGRIDSNDVGIGEFCQFCELVKAEPLVCVSFSDGAGSAADLVEFGDSWIPLAAEAVCDTRDMRQPDVMNHEIGAERVRTVALEPSGKSITLPAFSASALEWGRR